MRFTALSLLVVMLWASVCASVRGSVQVKVSVDTDGEEGSIRHRSHHPLAKLGSADADSAISSAPMTITKIANLVEYNQEDPRWKNVPYFLNHEYTLFDVGCTLTAVSMAAAWVTGDNSKWTPEYVNGNPSKGIQPHWSDAIAELKWDSLCSTCTDLYYQKPAGFIAKGSSSANSLYIKVRRAIDEGHIVLFGLDFSPALSDGTTRHTVVVMGYNNEGDLLIHDPAWGQPYQPEKWISHYTDMSQFSGYDLALAITDKTSLPVHL